MIDPTSDKILPVVRLLETTDLSERQIAELADVAPTTVARYRRIQHERGYTLPYLETLDDRELRRRFGHARRWRISKAIPHWPDVYRQMCRPGASLMSCWRAYRDSHPDGYSYPRFISYYGAWRYRLNILHRRQQQAGATVFIGSLGPKVPFASRGSRGIREADVYFATLGVSGYTYASAAEPQSKTQWLHFNVRAFEFFGGVPAVIERPYLEGGFESELTFNEDYERLALYFGAHLTPAFPYGIKIPVGPRLLSRWLASRLRFGKFASITEIDQFIQRQVVRVNHKPFRRLPGTRASWFYEVERPALRRLPTERFKLMGDCHAQY